MDRGTISHRPVGSLLERAHDLAILREALAGAAQRQSGIVVMEGPAGIGKTSLLAEGRRLAQEAGARILTARASEFEGELAFGVVRQLFEDDLVAELLTPPSQAPSPSRARDTSFAMLHSLYAVTVKLATDSPLAIVVDDLHWCDEASLRYLNYLVRRLDGLGIIVICTMRPREARARAPLVTDIVADPLATVVRPAPLSADATARLLGDGLGGDADQTFSAACHVATGGNPLLLKELMSTLRVENVTPDSAHVAAVMRLGPRAVSRAVLVRLARLDDNALRLARAASVTGPGAGLQLIAQLAGLESDDAVAAASTLVAAEILSDDGHAAFVHPLVGAAVYEDVPGHERALAHERAAQLLREAGSPTGSVATHLVLAPARGEEWVCDMLADAAHQSLRAGSPAGAVRYLTRALAEPPPPERRAQVLLELGGAEALLDAPSAIGHLTTAFEQGGDAAFRASAAMSLGRTLILNDRAEDCVALLTRVSAELDPDSDLRLGLEALELMAQALRPTLPVSPGELRLPLGRDAGPGAKMLAAVVARQCAYGGGTAEECTKLAFGALAGGELIAADGALLAVTAILTLVRADRREADESWEKVLHESRVRGSLVAQAGISLWRGYTFIRRGDLRAAEEALENSFEEFRLLFGEPRHLPHQAAFLSGVLREQGDLGRARRILDAIQIPSDASEGARYALDAQAELLLAERRFDEALLVAEDMERRFEFLVNPIDTPARSHRAVALHHLGHHEEAVELAAGSLELARRWGAPGSVARALRILGTLERGGGLDHLSEAVDVAEGSVARLEYAKALVSLGTALRLARRPTDARGPLRRGLELAAALGAAALVTHARHELRAAGARPRSTALTGPAALTPAERRITERAAAGETNRAIAESLFVTSKTVELHLRNAYRKLGVSSRRELPGKLG